MNILSSLTSYIAQKMVRAEFESQLKIKNIENFTPRPAPEDKTYLLYMHVPFCHTFCPYCSFHKFRYDEDAAKEYFKHLRIEMQKVKDEGFKFDTIYVGGGTTLINEVELAKTLELAQKLFGIDNISCETDPSHIQYDKLTIFKGLIKRLSIGVQSFNDDILKRTGRYQKFGSGKEILGKLEKIISILPTFSIDLIFNYPNQTEKMLIEDINMAKSLNLAQITTYPLMTSTLTKISIDKAFGERTKNNEHKFYELIQDQFRDYNQLNAWSFSKEKINMKDEYSGEHQEYVGIGSGAFSFLQNNLYVNTFNLKDYAKNIQNHGSSLMATCSFEKIHKIKYLFLTSLFDGEIDINSFNKSFNTNLQQMLFKEIKMLLFANAIKIKNDIIYTTDFGKYLCVVMMREFYSHMDTIRALYTQK